jgi:hypothetical protein
MEKYFTKVLNHFPPYLKKNTYFRGSIIYFGVYTAAKLRGRGNGDLSLPIAGPNHRGGPVGPAEKFICGI